MNRRAIFLDRDGTLNALVTDPVSGRPESPLRVEDVQLIPGAAAAARRLLEAGWLLVGASNQPAAAKGVVSVAQLDAIQARIIELMAAEGVEFTDFRICRHHPNGLVPGLSGSCDCRKPKPGLLLQAAAANQIDLSASWMIGDSDEDVLAGQAAGCRTVLLEHPPSAHRRSGSVRPTAVMPELDAAARWIMSLSAQLLNSPSA
jgi:D-glycero-D-manno-heptose 1,7-bisphosphate phosphatase